MTLTQGKTAYSTQPQTVPNHHLKAADHLEFASKAHREVARLHASGDYKAAELQSQVARHHTAKAGVHVNEANKKVVSIVMPHA